MPAQDARAKSREGVSEVQWLSAPSASYRVAKRALDIVLSTCALAFLLPMFFLVALMVKISSKGPVLYKQTRLGLHGVPFSFLKFRTMHVESDIPKYEDYLRSVLGRNAGSGQPVRVRDPRVTKIGAFLRKTSLDELPQFLNVLKGDMSIVGPRPPLQYEYEEYEPWHKLRLSALPGVTGLWQVSGKRVTTFDEMVQLDLDYIKHPSIFRDFKIMCKTPVVVFLADY